MAEELEHRVQALVSTGRVEEAIALLRVHVRTRPRDHAAVALLGEALRSAGHIDAALAQFQRAVALRPDSVVARHDLANCLLDARRPADAMAEWESALRLAPDHALLWGSLASAASEAGDSDRAIAAGRRALALDPNQPGCAGNLANAFLRAGDAREAFRVAADAYGRHPTEHLLGSITLMLSNYERIDRHEVLNLHRRFGAAVGAPALPARTAPDPDRPIRLGILSGDLRDHSVGFFAEALIAGAPAEGAVEVFNDVPKHLKDAATARLRAVGGTWHDCAGLDDQALDALIRSRKIDVLVELGGHTGINRLPCLGAKPAPVIVTAIGYPNTTGVPAIDWRVVDSITDPPGAEEWCTERLLRLDPCFLCYAPPTDAPEPTMPPADAPITFGSFNNAAKVVDETVRRWARAMDAVAGSRLLMKSQSLACRAAQDRIRARFAAAGIAADRLELIAQTPRREDHLALYGRVHVALDTMPYNGTTTTCEALWMGVPVVTTLGDRHAARVSASLLRAVGLDELVARDDDDFVQRAAALATDRDRLSDLRGSLRTRLAASPLLDRAAYAVRFHEGLRNCWRAWCRGLVCRP